MTASPPVLTNAAQLGATLHAARKARGVTQSDLAGRIGLSQSRISHLEMHAGELSFDQLLAWCGALGLELSVGARATATRVEDAADW